jgi:UPF0489 domain
MKQLVASIDYDTLVEDDSYLVDLSSHVWLMDDHRWALSVWLAECKNFAYSLIHADYHWDACYDFHGSPDMERELLSASKERLHDLISQGEWIRYDSFIAPALRIGLIKAVHFYCLQDEQSDNAFCEDFLAKCGATQVIHSDANSLASVKLNQPYIFDLCLDLFNHSDQWAEGVLWPTTEINAFLTTLQTLIQGAELVTISMSFNYSGTAEDTRKLTALVVPKILEWRA